MTDKKDNLHHEPLDPLAVEPEEFAPEYELPLPEPDAPAANPSAKGQQISYADAGVDITAGDRAKQRIKMLARKTGLQGISV